MGSNRSRSSRRLKRLEPFERLERFKMGIIKAYGKEEAVDYFKALARQGLHLHKGRTLRAQLMAAGEFPASVEQEVSKMVQNSR